MVDLPPQPPEPTPGVPGWYRHDVPLGMVRYWDGAAWTHLSIDDPAIAGYGEPHPTALDDDPANDDPIGIVGEEPEPDYADNPWEARRQRQIIDRAAEIDPEFGDEVADARRDAVLEGLPTLPGKVLDAVKAVTPFDDEGFEDNLKDAPGDILEEIKRSNPFDDK